MSLLLGAEVRPGHLHSPPHAMGANTHPPPHAAGRERRYQVGLFGNARPSFTVFTENKPACPPGVQEGKAGGLGTRWPVVALPRLPSAGCCHGVCLLPLPARSGEEGASGCMFVFELQES